MLITETNVIIMKNFDILWILAKWDRWHKVSKWCWENGIIRLAWRRLAINFQFAKNKNNPPAPALFVKPNKVKCSKMRYACTSYNSLGYRYMPSAFNFQPCHRQAASPWKCLNISEFQAVQCKKSINTTLFTRLLLQGNKENNRCKLLSFISSRYLNTQ